MFHPAYSRLYLKQCIYIIVKPQADFNSSCYKIYINSEKILKTLEYIKYTMLLYILKEPHNIGGKYFFFLKITAISVL